MNALHLGSSSFQRIAACLADIIDKDRLISTSMIPLVSGRETEMNSFLGFEEASLVLS
jgi:hypothetical protein